MTGTEVKRAIADVDHQLEDLRAWRQRLLAARRQALLDDSDTGRLVLQQLEHGAPPLQGNVTGLAELDRRPGLQGTEREIARLEERRELLVGQLPSPDQVATAEARLREFVAEATSAQAQGAEALEAFVELLHQVEEITGVVMRARRVTRAARLQAQTVAAEVGIAAPSVPEVPALARHLVEYALLVSGLVRDVGAGSAEPGEILARDLAAWHRTRELEAARAAAPADVAEAAAR